MRRYVALLLATTALTHLVIAQARAGTVIESDLSPDGVFGSSFATATPITPDVTDIVGNVDHYVQGFSNATNTPDFLDIQAAGYQAFQLVFTASPIGISSIGSSASASLASGGASYYATAFATALNSGGEGGSITLTPLPVTQAAASITATEGDTLGLTFAGSGIASAGVSQSGTSVPSSLDPILTFYDASGNLLDTVDLDINSGDSVTLDGSLDGNSDIYIGINTPFDYELEPSLSEPVNNATPVPEPASSAVLGLAAAALLAARRKKRVI
jgi:hypothetical protein